MKNMLYVAAFAIISLPLFAYAGPIIRSGESVSVDASQVLEGDFYGFAPDITISGSAEDDVYLIGGSVTINAPIGGDLTIVGGAAQVHESVNDDLRIVGGEATLAKNVKGDVVMAGGKLTVLSTASIEGDVIFMGGELIIEGEVKGGIHGAADKVRINAKIGGDLSITAESLLSLGDKAEVTNVTYKSRNDIVRAQNAKVSGNVRKVDGFKEVETGLIRSYAIFALIVTFAALSLFLIGRSRLPTVVEAAFRNIGLSGLLGLAVFVLMPFVSGIFMVSIIGSLLGISLLVLYIGLLLISFALTGVLVGYQVQKMLTKKTNITLSTVFFGTILYMALGLIPYIGGILLFAFFLVALGGVSVLLYRGIKP